MRFILVEMWSIYQIQKKKEYNELPFLWKKKIYVSIEFTESSTGPFKALRPWVNYFTSLCPDFLILHIPYGSVRIE